ncbi:MAG: hypothetical protein AB1397_00600 [bacterium]
MEQRIKTFLEREVKPILASHGGGCEFVKLTKGYVFSFIKREEKPRMGRD